MKLIVNYMLGIAINANNIGNIQVFDNNQGGLGILFTPNGFKSVPKGDAVVSVDGKIIFYGDIVDCQQVWMSIVDYLSEPDNYDDGSWFDVGSEQRRIEFLKKEHGGE